MQFNRDEAGVMHPLPKPSVDTGMGLERISAVLQHVHANYEIDLFQALIAAAARETSNADMDSPSLKVLADHIRACSFLIADGVIPGNEGRGYVLRRIIRRAIRHGYKLGARAAFFHKMVPDLVAEMGEAYPELKAGQQRVTDILKQEEDRFFATIENGMAILEGELAAMAAAGNTVFNGETAFKLHDTFGFPLDLTADVCRERGVTVDAAAFDAAMARQKEQARAAGKFKMAANLEYDGPATTFHGYDGLEAKGNMLALYKDGVAVNELPKARWAWWCSTTPRSTPNPAARWATAASCARCTASSPSKTPRRSRPPCSATTAWSPPASSRWATASPPRSTPPPAPAPPATTRPPT
jgi:alanyl-tRNA synthetase